MADQELLQRLVVSLEGRMTAYEKALAKARGDTATTFGRMQRQGKDFEKSFSGIGDTISRRFTTAFAAIGAGFSLKVATQFTDAATRISNSLKIAGLEGEKLTQVYDALYQSADRNAAPLEALVQLYGRASLVQKELGISTEQLLNFTDKVAVALRVSGKSAEESSGALLQLSQALGSGIVRAEEFNSILEGALPIAQAAAAGLEQAGGSVAKLRALVVDGKVSSKAFFDAFEAGSSILTEKVAGAELTLSQRFVRLQNVLIDTSGKFDDATGFSDALGSGLDGLAGFVEKVGTAFANNKDHISEFFAAIRQGVAETDTFMKGHASSSEPGATDFFEPIDFDGLTKWVQGLVPQPPKPATVPGADLPIPAYRPNDLGLPIPTYNVPVAGPATPARDNSADLRTFREADYASVAALPKAAAPVKTVSLDDYPVTGTSGRSSATSAVEKQRQAVLDLIDSLEFEKSLIGQSTLEQEIQNTIRQAGGEATDEQRASIRTLLTDMDAERAAIEANSAAMQEFADIARAALGGFVDDLLAGKSAAEALEGVASKLAKSFLNKAIDAGIDMLIGAIFPGFASGGYTGAGARLEPAGIVHRGEFVVNAAQTAKHMPLLAAINRGLPGFAEGGLVAPPDILVGETGGLGEVLL